MECALRHVTSVKTRPLRRLSQWEHRATCSDARWTRVTYFNVTSMRCDISHRCDVTLKYVTWHMTEFGLIATHHFSQWWDSDLCICGETLTMSHVVDCWWELNAASSLSRSVHDQVVTRALVRASVIVVNENKNKNGEKRENNEFVNEN